MINYFIGTIFVLLGIYQIYTTEKYFRQLNVANNAMPGNFTPLALWSGLIFGVIFILAGLSFGLGLYH